MGKSKVPWPKQGQLTKIVYLAGPCIGAPCTYLNMIKEVTNTLQLEDSPAVAGPLAERVMATLWFTCGSTPVAGRAVMDLLPTASAMLHIHYGHDESTRSIRITGPHATHVPWLLRPGHELFTIVFKPHGWAALTGMAMEEMVNKCMPGDQLFAQGAQQALLELCSPRMLRSPQDKVLAWLEQHLVKGPLPPLSSMDKVLDDMEAKKGIGKVEDYLLPDTHIRTLQRYCKKNVGIAPKTILALIRHRHVLMSIASNEKERWQDIVQEGFFYDQSHYRRVRNKFRKPGLLTGCEAIP